MRSILVRDPKLERLLHELSLNGWTKVSPDLAQQLGRSLKELRHFLIIANDRRRGVSLIALDGARLVRQGRRRFRIL